MPLMQSGENSVTNRFVTVRQGRVVTVFDAAVYPDFDPGVFDDGDWHTDKSQAHTETGRGGVRMRDTGSETWVRRHYHRGGFVSRLIYDSYWWNGLERSRPIREVRLLAHMRALDLPVPAPVAGRIIVGGPTYRADLITVLLPDTRPLSRAIAESDVTADVWPRIGIMLARVHSAGVDHPDLTAHNILVDSRDHTWLLDFDNGAVRKGSDWKAGRIARLRRSLRKVALETGTGFDEAGWAALVDAYRSS